MTKQQIIDQLGRLKELGVAISSAPIPRLGNVDAYFDYTQWIAEEIMPTLH